MTAPRTRDHSPPERPYHRFVFDARRRAFVGAFEEMYRAEDREGFASWTQDDLTHPTKRVARALLDGYEFRRAIDLGCGTGAFTHLLHKEGREIVGLDVSPTAVSKAHARYPHVRFEAGDATRPPWKRLGRFDLALMIEILSYVPRWRAFLRDVAAHADRALLSLYLPPDPIGFVKSFDALRAGFDAAFVPESEILVNRDTLLLVGRSRRARRARRTTRGA